jgi:hypothetical protein
MTTAIKSVTRGNTIRITSRFYDFDNNETIPGTASVRIVYKVANTAMTNTISMSYSANVGWSTIWDTTGKDVGVVNYHVYTNDGFHASEDGQLTIVAGPANPSP